jgi:hydrogenase nickel incorporation protein HypA/HybF
VREAAREIPHRESARPGRVSAVTVRFGELQNIDPESFTAGLQELTIGTQLENTSFKLELQDARLGCRICNGEWTLSEVSLSEDEREAIHFVPEVVHTFAVCPNCGSRDFAVLQGRGVEILEISYETDPRAGGVS